MKFTAINTTDLIQLAVGALAVGAVIYYANKKVNSVGDSLNSLGNSVSTTLSTTLNPVSPENAVYKNVNAAGAGITGDSGFDLGSWWYDLINPAVVDENGVVITPAITPGQPPLVTALGQ